MVEPEVGPSHPVVFSSVEPDHEVAGEVELLHQHQHLRSPPRDAHGFNAAQHSRYASTLRFQLRRAVVARFALLLLLVKA